MGLVKYLALCTLTLMGIVFTAECTEVEPECPRFCPLIWSPVCGSDGKTYAHLCELEKANCNKKPEDKITVKYTGVCKSTETECPIICLAVYEPVCGSDGNTYSNECYIIAANCWRKPQDQISVKYQGECKEFKPNCPKACPLIWSPLCGTDKITYGNICQLEMANCNKKAEDQIKKSFDGVCKDPTDS